MAVEICLILKYISQDDRCLAEVQRFVHMRLVAVLGRPGDVLTLLSGGKPFAGVESWM